MDIKNLRKAPVRTQTNRLRLVADPYFTRQEFASLPEEPPESTKLTKEERRMGVPNNKKRYRVTIDLAEFSPMIVKDSVNPEVVFLKQMAEDESGAMVDDGFIMDITSEPRAPMRYKYRNLYTYRWGVEMTGVPNILTTELNIITAKNPLTGDNGQYAIITDHSGKRVVPYVNIRENLPDPIPFSIRKVFISTSPQSKYVMCHYFLHDPSGTPTRSLPLTFKAILPKKVNPSSCKWKGRLVNKYTCQHHPTMYCRSNPPKVKCEQK